MKKPIKKSVLFKIAKKRTTPEKIVIPPDALGDKISNESVEQSKANIISEQSVEKVVVEKVNVPESDKALEQIVEEVKNSEEPTFYEKVTGEKQPIKVKQDLANNYQAESEGNFDQEELPQIEKRNKKLFLLGGVVFALTVLITLAAGIFIINSSKVNKVKEPEQQRVELTASPTPISQTINRDEWKFEVLNGSGKAGEAGKASEKLEDLGYEVVKVGNSEKLDATEVYIKSSKEKESALLLKDLEEEFGILEISGELTDSKADVRLILGGD